MPLTLLKHGGFSSSKQTQEEADFRPSGRTHSSLGQPPPTPSSGLHKPHTSREPSDSLLGLKFPQSSQPLRGTCQARWTKPGGRAWHSPAPAHPAQRLQCDRVAAALFIPKVSGCFLWGPLGCGHDGKDRTWDLGWVGVGLHWPRRSWSSPYSLQR